MMFKDENRFSLFMEALVKSINYLCFSLLKVEFKGQSNKIQDTAESRV